MDKIILRTVLLYSINADNQGMDIDNLKQLSIDDWNEIMPYIEKHRIVPLFYYRLRLDNLDSYIPDEFIFRQEDG